MNIRTKSVFKTLFYEHKIEMVVIIISILLWPLIELFCYFKIDY